MPDIVSGVVGVTVFVTRKIPSTALDTLRDAADVTVWPDPLPPSYQTLRETIADCDGLLCLLTERIDAPLLNAAPNVRVISQMAVGYDNIDVDAATARGIPVGHTPGVLTETTADLTWALLLATARRVLDGVRYVEAGNWRTWDPLGLLGIDVHGATLGIVGLGRIGTAVARRAQGFAMRILYTGPREKPAVAVGVNAHYVDFDTLLAESDIVSLHCPLTPETRHLIDETALARMKPGALLINTARGEVVDQEALLQALREGHLGGAGLDVTNPEPLPADHPLLSQERVVVTPHIGSASVQARTRMAEMAVENLLAGLRGERLPYCVNPEVYKKREK